MSPTSITLTFVSVCLSEADMEADSPKEDTPWLHCSSGQYPLPAPCSLGPTSSLPQPIHHSPLPTTGRPPHASPTHIKIKALPVLPLLCLVCVYVHPTAALHSHSGGECGHEHRPYTNPLHTAHGHGTHSGPVMEPMFQLLLETNLQQQAVTQELAQSLRLATHKLLQLKKSHSALFQTPARKPSVCSPGSRMRSMSRPS